MWDKGLTPPCLDVTFQFKFGSVQRAGAIGLATATSREVGESSTQTRYMATTKGTLGMLHNPLNNERVSQTNQMAKNKSLKASSSRLSKDKKNPKSKGSKSLKRSNPETDSSLQLSFTEATSNKKYGSPSSPLSTSNNGGLGSLVQKQSGSGSGGGDYANKGYINGDVGLVQRETEQGLEALVPDNPNQCKDRQSASGSSDIGNNAKPLVEVSH